jgi:L-alanine-DL-glutamate epimerase-like enolase superfamily enzyme
MFYRTYKLGVMGAQMEGIAGIDIALWDILGKATGLPVSTLLGGRYRETIPLYASIGGGAGMTVSRWSAMWSRRSRTAFEQSRSHGLAR